MSEQFFDRPLPAKPHIENALIGMVVMTGKLPEFPINTNDFNDPRNRKIWKATCALIEERVTLDIRVVFDRAGDPDLLPWLAQITEGLVIGPQSLDWHAKQVRGVSLRRRALRLAHDLAERAYAQDEMPEIVEGFFDAARELSGDQGEMAQGIGADELEARTASYARNLDAQRTPTGIKALDEVIGGIGRGQVLTILARTGVGKSAIAQNIVRSFLRMQTQSSVIFCSAEMPAPELWIRQRQIEAEASEGAVIAAYRTGNELSPGFMARAQRRMLVIPRANAKLSEIERIIDHAVVRGQIEPPQHVIFDYAKLFAGDRPSRSDSERVGDVARGVKILAKNLNVSAILLSQTGRGTGNDGTQPVTINDARDSGEIEEACDFLLGVWRPGMNTGDPRTMKMAILKGRRCPRREFTMLFGGPTLRLTEDWASD